MRDTQILPKEFLQSALKVKQLRVGANIATSKELQRRNKNFAEFVQVYRGKLGKNESKHVSFSVQEPPKDRDNRVSAKPPNVAPISVRQLKEQRGETVALSPSSRRTEKRDKENAKGDSAAPQTKPKKEKYPKLCTKSKKLDYKTMKITSTLNSINERLRKMQEKWQSRPHLFYKNISDCFVSSNDVKLLYENPQVENKFHEIEKHLDDIITVNMDVEKDIFDKPLDNPTRPVVFNAETSKLSAVERQISHVENICRELYQLSGVDETIPSQIQHSKEHLTLPKEENASSSHLMGRWEKEDELQRLVKQSCYLQREFGADVKRFGEKNNNSKSVGRLGGDVKERAGGSQDSIVKMVDDFKAVMKYTLYDPVVK